MKEYYKILSKYFIFLINLSCHFPVQIEIDEGRLNGLHVITDTRKNFFRSTVFRLSSFETDDVWTTLKMSPRKPGVAFRPLRKVF